MVVSMQETVVGFLTVAMLSCLYLLLCVPFAIAHVIDLVTANPLALY